MRSLIEETEAMTHAALQAMQDLPCFRLPEGVSPEKRRALARLQVLVAAADERAKAALAEAVELGTDLQEIGAAAKREQEAPK